MKPNPYVRDGLALVSKVRVTEDLKADIARAVELIGGFEKILNGDESVLLFTIARCSRKQAYWPWRASWELKSSSTMKMAGSGSGSVSAI